MCIRELRCKMIKTLIKHGNSLALVIDKPILELLRISPDTLLEITTNGDSMVISPKRDKARQKKLEKTLEKINSRYGEDLKKLSE